MTKPGTYILIAIVLLMLSAYVLPYWVLGENGHYMIWDNLDSAVIWVKLAAQKKYIFCSGSKVLDELSFVKRYNITPETDLSFWFVYFFGPLHGYVLQRTIIVFIAFGGMYLLLANHVNSAKVWKDRVINSGVSLGFATLPFLPSGLLSIAGLPILAFAFLNLYKLRSRISDYFILVAIPFYSSFVLSGFFFLFLVTLVWIAVGIRHRKFHRKVFIGILVLTVSYILTNFRLVESYIFDPTYVSNRIDFYKDTVNLHEAFYEFKNLFLGPGLGHALTLHDRVIVPVTCLALIILLYKRYLNHYRYLLLILSIILFTSLFYGFIYAKPLHTIFSRSPMLFQRFHWLHPFLWFLTFAIALKILSNYLPDKGKYILVVPLLLQLLYNLSYHEFWVNRANPSFAEFYAVDQFEEIKRYIHREQESYKVASVGMHPAVALYNGFHCVDVYLNNYPLSYKKEFRKVIAEELKKHDKLEKYYDEWGCRVYLFSVDLGNYKGGKLRRSDQTADDSITVSYDLEELKKLQCEYLISSHNLIFNGNGVGNLVRVFNHPASAWKIYLYRI